jgi:hypothetical protein
VERRPRYAIWDKRQEHLALRVASTGRLVWNFVYQHHGQSRWHKFGSFPNIGVADARKLCRKFMVQVDDGGDPQADRMAQRKQGTVEDLIPDYVNDRKNGPHGKAWKQTERLLVNHVQPTWGKLRPGEIRDTDMQSLLRKYAGKPAMQNAVRNAATAFLTWTKGGSKLNKLKPRERNLSEAELPAWWAGFEAAGVPGRALQVLLLTGQRPIEVARMRTEHIDKYGWWEQPGQPEEATKWPGVKNKKDHRVFVSEPARAIIESAGTNGFVFTGPTGIGAVRSLDKTMRNCADTQDFARPSSTGSVSPLTRCHQLIGPSWSSWQSTKPVRHDRRADDGAVFPPVSGRTPLTIPTRRHIQRGRMVSLKMRYRTVREPVTLDLWKRHLAGKYPLVLGLACDDGTSCVSVVDVDMCDIDAAAIVRAISMRKLRFYVRRSKSSGAHVYAFHDKPIPMAKATAFAEEMARCLGLTKVEFFPKPQNPDPNVLPKGLNMPYLGGEGGFIRPGSKVCGEILHSVVHLTCTESRVADAHDNVMLFRVS